MQHSTRTIIAFEFTKTIRRLSFWLATILFPLFIVVIIAITQYTGSTTQRNASASAVADRSILVVDPGTFFASSTLTDNLTRATSVESAIDRVRTAKVDAALIVPSDFGSSSTYTLIAQDLGLTGNTAYTQFAEQLITQQVLARTDEPVVRAVVENTLRASTTWYSVTGNIESDPEIADFILPGIGFLVFFLAVFMSSQYLLQSVTEEKENRTMESLLAVVSKHELIAGKVLGLSLIALTQLAIWATLIGGVVYVALNRLALPPETLAIGDTLAHISLTDGLVTLLYIVFGYLLFASIMVGVGSIGTTQRESQQMSSIFIIAAIFPVYFSSLIVADPDGAIAQFFTYFPFTSALIGLLRHALDALSLHELLFSLLLNSVYVIAAFWLAQKLFTLGMLMYNRKPSWREVHAALRQ